MPTENPKISAYVPQLVYDKFIEFRDEKGISMSQAATIVFAEFFGVDLSSEFEEQQFTTGIPDRLNAVDDKFNFLENQIQELRKLVESMKSTSEPPVDSISYKQMPLIEEFGLNGSNEDVDKINNSALAKRLNVDNSYLVKKRKKLSEEDFSDYTKSKDPENIGWAYSEAEKLYFPKSI